LKLLLNRTEDVSKVLKLTTGTESLHFTALEKDKVQEAKKTQSLRIGAT